MSILLDGSIQEGDLGHLDLEPLPKELGQTGPINLPFTVAQKNQTIIQEMILQIGGAYAGLTAHVEPSAMPTVILQQILGHVAGDGPDIHGARERAEAEAPNLLNGRARKLPGVILDGVIGEGATEQNSMNMGAAFLFPIFSTGKKTDGSAGIPKTKPFEESGKITDLRERLLLRVGQCYEKGIAFSLQSLGQTADDPHISAILTASVAMEARDLNEMGEGLGETAIGPFLMQRGNRDEILAGHREKILIFSALGLTASRERSIRMNTAHNLIT